MAAGESVRTIRAPGRLVVNPTQALASATCPYGGVEVGKAIGCVLLPMDRPFAVVAEGLDEPIDILRGGSDAVFTCLLRGWDDDAIAQFRSGGYTPGAQSQHAMYSVPKTNVAGTSMLDRAVRLLYVPDDTLHVPALIMYRAVPHWQEGAQIPLQRGADFVLPITFRCLRDATDRIFVLSRLHDLAST